jgi:glycosyltransferase involved in cell wall biosynthesis
VELLSVVIPAHEEESFLKAAVTDIDQGLRSRGLDFEIVIVENGSTDSTAAIAADLAAELPEVVTFSLPAADYGAALKRGFLAAAGDVVAIFDVDYYDLTFLDQALSRIQDDTAEPVAVVVASKRGEGAHDRRSLSRRVVTSGFSLILRGGFGLTVSDTHGMKVLRREPLVPLAEASRFGTDLFDTELILRAQRAGLRAAEIPVSVSEKRPSRSSILARIPRTIAGLVRLRVALWRDR